MDNLHQKSASTSSTQPQEEDDSKKMTRSASKSTADHQKPGKRKRKEPLLQFKSFSIQKIEDMGMGWVAEKDVPAGSLLLEEFPVLHAPDFEWSSSFSEIVQDRKCVACGIKCCLNDTKTCPTCFWPVCSDRCKEDPFHIENECEEFVSRKLEYPPPRSWPIGMLVFCLRANALKARDPRKFKKLMTLQDFYTIPSLNQELQKLDLPQGMFEVLSGPWSLDRDEFRKLLRILKVNSFDGESDPCESSEGDGSQNSEFKTRVYLKASRLNHSCFPNCTTNVFASPSTKVQITTTVPVYKGQELTINYFDDWFGFGATPSRQMNLKENGFICKCRRCLDPTELGTFLSGIKCFKCSRDLKASSPFDSGSGSGDNSVGFFVPVHPLGEHSPSREFNCHRCHVKYPLSQIRMTFPTALQNTLGNITKLLSSEPVDYKALETLLTNYEKKDSAAKGYLHKNNWLIQGPLRLLIEAQMETLDKTPKREMDRLVRRLEFILAIDEQLYPGSTFRPKYEDLGRMSKAIAILLSRFGVGMTLERLLSLTLMGDLAERGQRAFLSR